MYRPRDSERLILYLKDLNLPKPDKYDTCMLIAFLQQLITFGGFYDESLEFLHMERVQIVCSMNPATTVGRWPLSTRFTAIVRIGILDYPDSKELVSVYEALLGVVFHQMELSRAGDAAQLAQTMVELYEQLRTNSLSMTEHYLFTPRDITVWTRGLLRYNMAAGGENLVDVVAHEAYVSFAIGLLIVITNRDLIPSECNNASSGLRT